LKILQVCNFYKPSWEAGGTVRVAYEISKKLINKGHQVTVYTTDGFKSRLNVQKNSQIDIDGAKIYYFKNLSNFTTRKLIFPIPYYLISVIKENITNFDIIHIHEHRTFSAIFIGHYAKKNKIPYVIHGHGSISTEVDWKIPKIIFDFLFGYRIIKNAHSLIAVSQEEANHYRKIVGSKKNIIILYNGLDINNYNKEIIPGKFKEQHKITDDIILYLGRLNKAKGIDFAMLAFAELIKEKQDICFVIIGPDDGYEHFLKILAIELKIADKVKFIGFIDEKLKQMAYSDARLFIHTAYGGMGGVGLAPLEAILCGTPVVVTPECGEIINQCECGYIVNYGDVEGLKEIMKSVLTTPKNLSKIKRGIAYIHNNLTWDKYADQLEQLYKNIIEK
jgi:glycosyltransferase involved in cell wall biosynthesis